MARITLFPHDNTATIDGNYAPGIDYAGIDPTIHCVQWYDTEGWVEYDADLMTGAKPPNEIIYSIAPYLSFVSQAEVIIEAYLNPQIWYSTSDSTIWQGSPIPIGDVIEISTPNTLPPATTTNEPPPTPENFQDLWFYNDNWVLSPFNPEFTLQTAQSQLIEQVQVSGAEQADYQARIYSAYSLVASGGAAGSLPTADYYGLDLAAYQTYIDGEVATMTATINAATDTTQLYSFDWRVEGNPNN